MNGRSNDSSRRANLTMLRGVHVGLRQDLEVSRHVFRSEPAYVVRDPVTFQSQRLSLADYEILVHLNASQPLDKIFEELVELGKLATDEERRFYEFILRLHRLGFLHLPLADSKQLYQRNRARQRARRREKLWGFLFLRIPVWCPDAFLARTVDGMRWLFSTPFFVCWLLIVGGACIVAARHWHELMQPLSGVVTVENLPLMWVTLVAMKVVHEFGHAYACKHYGGHVPEMGVYLVVFTPCAYVDASACWGFSRKFERVAVCLAGMYVEALIAALAVFVWASSEPSMLKTVAYNTMFLAGAVTVLFNINPLLRYDGYYVLSDLVEVPNLRQRSTQYLLRVLKRVLLGVCERGRVNGVRLRAILFGYGVASLIYRVGLVVAIAALLAVKMRFSGVALGGVFLGGLILGRARRLIRYLWFAEETARRRYRAVGLGVTVLLVFPAVLAVVPLPAAVRVPGFVAAEQETVVRAASGGFVERVSIEEGQIVQQGATLVELVNEELAEELAFAELQVKTSAIRREAYRATQPIRAQQAQDAYEVHRRHLNEIRSRVARLRITAPASGRIVRRVPELEVGAFLAEGAAVATIASGPWRAKTLLTETQIASVRPHPGDRVQFRPKSGGAPDLVGVVARIAPAASELPFDAIARSADAREPASRLTGVRDPSPHPCFVVTLDLPGAGDPKSPDGPGVLRHRMNGSVRFQAGFETVARRLGQRFLRFWNHLLES